MIIAEGDNGTISCRSVGAPVPSITWEFNNQITGFEQTDILTPYQAALTGSVGNRVVDLTPGNTVSTLHIVSARYPDHDGVYTCIGTNADDQTVANRSAIVSVQVHGKTLLEMLDTVQKKSYRCKLLFQAEKEVQMNSFTTTIFTGITRASQQL